MKQMERFFVFDNSGSAEFFLSFPEPRRRCIFGFGMLLEPDWYGCGIGMKYPVKYRAALPKVEQGWYRTNMRVV
jgi:hypothetical protein